MSFCSTDAVYIDLQLVKSEMGHFVHLAESTNSKKVVFGFRESFTDMPPASGRKEKREKERNVTRSGERGR